MRYQRDTKGTLYTDIKSTEGDTVFRPIRISLCLANQDTGLSAVGKLYFPCIIGWCREHVIGTYVQRRRGERLLLDRTPPLSESAPTATYDIPHAQIVALTSSFILSFKSFLPCLRPTSSHTR